MSGQIFEIYEWPSWMWRDLVSPRHAQPHTLEQNKYTRTEPHSTCLQKHTAALYWLFCSLQTVRSASFPFPQRQELRAVGIPPLHTVQTRSVCRVLEISVIFLRLTFQQTQKFTRLDGCTVVWNMDSFQMHFFANQHPSLVIALIYYR
jgi:hypothetical protein